MVKLKLKICFLLLSTYTFLVLGVMLFLNIMQMVSR